MVRSWRSSACSWIFASMLLPALAAAEEAAPAQAPAQAPAAAKPAEPAGAPASGAPASLDPGLAGTWAHACKTLPQIGIHEHGSALITLVLEPDGKARLETRRYRTWDECDDEAEVTDVATYHGTWKVPAAGEVDIELPEVTRTAPNAERAGDYDDDEACGLKGWKPGEPRAVTGRVCYGWKQKGKWLFVTYLREGDTLHLAKPGEDDEDDGLTAESRARNLEKDDPLTRRR